MKFISIVCFVIVGWSMANSEGVIDSGTSETTTISDVEDSPIVSASGDKLGATSETPQNSSQTTEEGDPAETYSKVAALVNDAVEVQQKDGYFHTYLEGKLQELIRIPIIDAIVSIQHFSKIEKCFTDLKESVQKVIGEQVKEYQECFTKQGLDCGKLVSDKADTSLQPIAAKIVECTNSNA